jgi:hypothetical protein
MKINRGPVVRPPCFLLWRGWGVYFVCACVRHVFWRIWPKVRRQFGGSILSNAQIKSNAMADSFPKKDAQYISIRLEGSDRNFQLLKNSI